MSISNISNLTLDEIKRQLYISGSPNHALFVKLQEDIEDEQGVFSEESLDEAYNNGYQDGYLAAEVELE